MDLSEMRLDDAQRYCDLVASQTKMRMSELAWWLRADGIDLDQFDASAPSLVPLWEWFVDFAYARACPKCPRGRCMLEMGAVGKGVELAASTGSHGPGSLRGGGVGALPRGAHDAGGPCRRLDGVPAYAPQRCRTPQRYDSIWRAD